ncbi:tetratricopeptide repeat protein [Actinoplanes aureus]|uniref:Tetratricopeptide repeat protein n=1 Tax=Actinoplanes aureus TaxID=2792083 RepID=A0A931CEM7_9ACTN|nr:tetratricopeptide repeat protein [Actinoplanes aureus]MBG0565136.1 tetratricopeptide repeat protein [Actinoplanes aureus]
MTSTPASTAVPAVPLGDPDGASARAFADPTDLAVARAAALFEHLQPEKAAEMLAPVLAARPDSAPGWILMARVRLALDQVEPALDAATRAVDLVPDDPRPLAIASRALTLLGRHDEAMGMAYRAVIVEPKNPLWHDRVAWALLAADRQLADAEQAARTAIGLDPTEAHYYFTHGVALAALGHVDQARQALLTSLRLEPGNPVAKHRLDVLNGEAVPVVEKKKRGWKLFGRKEDSKPVRPEEHRP